MAWLGSPVIPIKPSGLWRLPAYWDWIFSGDSGTHRCFFEIANDAGWQIRKDYMNVQEFIVMWDVYFAYTSRGFPFPWVGMELPYPTYPKQLKTYIEQTWSYWNDNGQTDDKRFWLQQVWTPASVPTTRYYAWNNLEGKFIDLATGEVGTIFDPETPTYLTAGNPQAMHYTYFLPWCATTLAHPQALDGLNTFYPTVPGYWRRKSYWAEPWNQR